MRWYEGNIAEAVTLSRNNNAVFVVYIEGKDDQSSRLTQFIEDTTISSTLSSSSFVAIKVEAGSIPHLQFSEIYKDTPIPSIYFIGKTGAPLEIVKEASDPVTFLQKVTTILQRNGTSIPDVTSPTVNTVNDSPSVSSQSASTSSNAFIATEQAGASESEVICDGDVCTVRPRAKAEEVKMAGEVKKAEEVEQKAELTHDEKVALAKELIEKKRVEKQKEEDEKERLKELERRKMGQEVQGMNRWQKDQELKQMMDERAKVKQEEKLARQRILEQIAQDKADRAKKFAPAAEAKDTAAPSPVTRPPVNSNTARLQFRLADGSARTQDFPATATLASVRTYVRETLQLSQCALSMTFPRREFTAQDDGSTLIELALVPNAVLLVLPATGGSGGGASGGGGILAAGGTGNSLILMLWSLLTPLMNVLGWIKSYLFGVRGTTSGGGTTGGTSESARAAEKRAAPVDSNRADTSRPLPKRKPGDAGTTVIRRQGNIHRLSDPNDSDEDNNTWNGNSTQQM